MAITYQFPMFHRLEHCTTWNGGMLAGTDVVTLEEAARFASKHAGAEITSADFLRAAGRGQIPMQAICPRAVRMEPCRETDQVLTMPKNCIPTLPLDACRALSFTGRAEWRTLDGFEKVEIFGDVLCRFTRWQLPDTESDILTTPADCRVTGWDVHALADAFIDKPAPAQNQATTALAELSGESVQGNEKIRYAVLASRTELIEALGCYGLELKIFKAIKDRPWLEAARRVTGTGQGRNSVEPMFCPFEVINGLEKKGIKDKPKLTAHMGWHILETKFQNVYAEKSMCDPR